MKEEYESYICKDGEGNVFISLEGLDEGQLSRDPLLTHCLAVVKVGDDYLLGWNKWRSRYEIFGGSIEAGETSRECIERECGEELGISPSGTSEIEYLGAMRFLMMPDYFSPEERVELGGLYGIRLPAGEIAALSEGVRDREEIAGLALYSQVKGSAPIAVIDERLLGYFK